MNALLPLALVQQRPTASAGKIETAFTAIRVEGGLFPAEFMQRVAKQEAPGQSDADYAVPPGRTLRDEIGRFWTIAEAQWREYKRDRERADLRPERTGIERWLTRFLRDVLGYSDIALCAPPSIGERSFPIRHLAHDGAVPLLLTTHTHDLDRAHASFGDDGRRRAPHAAMQEYLNAEPAALWGFAINGNRLRLLRDNPSLTRPAYVEADLERIFEEGLYPDFAALFLIAHASRVAPVAGGMSGCWLERWRAEGAKVGQRALDRLRVGVTTALRDLGSGFVENPENDELRLGLRDGAITADGLHQQLLRLVYRLLFLFTAEERDLLHAPDAAPEARALYAQGYGLARLRERARLKRHYSHHTDLWTGLTITFRALSRGASPLGLPALGGLFDAEQCPLLDGAAISNKALLAGIHALAFFEDRGSLQRVNYRDMGTEELGSVYESLLELHPVVQVAAKPWSFAFAGDDMGGTTKGSERKLSGSYYTPDSLVQELLRSALDPVIERAQRDNPTDPRGALLRLRVLDPACGSGHFLLGAARRLSDAVARLDMEGDLPDEAVRRRALREVVRRCIFGVDRNPLSVELCKTALWIEAVEPGRPLTFLDAHVKCGDSLIGVADLSVLKAGIPDEAFKELTGDDKTYCKDLRKRNRAERENPTLSLLPEVALPTELASAIAALTDAPEDTVEAVQEKRRALASLQSGRAAHDLRVACDLWCAAFFAPKAAAPEMRGRDMVPTTDTVWRYLRAPSSVYGPLVGAVEELSARLRLFHWPLEFPDAFAAGGFDCVLGNPPWEVLQLGEEEYFAARSPSIAAMAGARRKAAIRALETTEPAIWAAYQTDLHLVEATNQFIRECGHFNLTARGKLNTYAMFAEAFLRLPSQRGRAGVIVPTGIATDDGNKAFFDEVAGKMRLASLYDFENREGLFPAVDSRMKFALLTLGNGEATARFVFFAMRVEHLSDERRAFTLSAGDIRLINPNTRTTPVFRSSTDAELSKRVYARVAVLIDESAGTRGNPWGLSFRQGLFNLTSESGLFRTPAQLAEAEGVRDGANWLMPDGTRMLPLYEAKMIHHFDHRWATYEGEGDGSRDTTLVEKADPSFAATPRYWVPEQEVEERIPLSPAPLARAYKLGDERLCREVITLWLCGRHLAFGPSSMAQWALNDIQIPHKALQGSLLTGVKKRAEIEAIATALHDESPMTETDRAIIAEHEGNALEATRLLLDRRKRRWLIGWRDICRATDERTVIASVMPVVGVGNSLPLLLPSEAISFERQACLIGCLSSLACDFFARHKVGGTHLNFFVARQLPVLGPDSYSAEAMEFLVPRILELTYTAEDLRPWAEDLGHTGPPFGWDETRRAHLRAELDAAYAHLYSLTRDELRYILDPTDVHGADFPSETFRVLKEKEVRLYGEYRTRRLVLGAWDRLTEDGTFAEWS